MNGVIRDNFLKEDLFSIWLKWYTVFWMELCEIIFQRKTHFVFNLSGIQYLSNFEEIQAIAVCLEKKNSDD